jgi:hypothetical protein
MIYDLKFAFNPKVVSLMKSLAQEGSLLGDFLQFWL